MDASSDAEQEKEVDEAYPDNENATFHKLFSKSSNASSLHRFGWCFGGQLLA